MSEKPRCPRCHKVVKDRGVTVGGLVYGPSCGKVVSRRQRARESFGESQVQVVVCSISGKGFYAKKESFSICPSTQCAHCRYNTLSFLAVELCPLEVEVKQKELNRWKL